MQELRSDNIDINSLFKFIWYKRYPILLVSFISSIILLIYSLQLPPRYKSEILLKPAEVPGLKLQSGNNLGGLAAIASSSLGIDQDIDKSIEAIKIMESRKFVETLSEESLFLPYIYASLGWNNLTNEVIFDSSIYDHLNNKWIIDLEAPPHKNNIYKNWKRDFSIKLDKDGFIFASFNHASPQVAKEILEWAIKAINLEMKLSSAKDAENSYIYLENGIKNITSNEIKEIFYNLMQEQLRILMLINSSSEFVFKVIDPAFVPQQKYKPLISLIVIVGSLLSAFLSILFFLILEKNGFEFSNYRIHQKKDL